MNLSEYGYLWKEDKEKYVLVKVDTDYVIINRVNQMMLLIEDDILAEVVVNEMLKHGNLVYGTIDDAYESVKKD